MRAIVAGCVLAVLSTAGAALAQGAPATRQPVADPLRKIQVLAFAGEPSQWPAPPPDMIRRAAVQGDPAGWLDENDAPIAAWRQAPQSGNVTLKLETSAAGRVVICAPIVPSYGQQPAWAADLCPPLVARARVVPALRADGSRMADEIIFSANFQYVAFVQNRPGPLIESHGLSPAPPPPSDFNPDLRAWPPSANWLRRVAQQPAFRQPPEQPGGEPLTGPATGVVIADRQSGAPECRVVLSSGDAQADSRACGHVRKVLKPKWAETVPPSLRRWPVLLGASGKVFRAIGPDPSAIRRLDVDPAEVERLAALWRPEAPGVGPVRMSATLGADGRPTGCRVYQSSGNDAADAAACRLFQSEARFTPARDAFGQPGRLEGWVGLGLQ